MLRLQADRPVKGLWLQARGVSFADNFIDLMPGEPRWLDQKIAVPFFMEAVALDHAMQRFVLQP